MYSGSEQWCLIESDPEIFSDLIQKIGAKNLILEEVLSLDAADLQRYKKVYGLVFLHAYKGTLISEVNSKGDPQSEGIYFAKQVVDNSCASVALLNLLGNLPDEHFDESLKQFLDYTRVAEPYTRGAELVAYDPIRIAHNSFASPYENFYAHPDRSESNGNAYHFISYVYLDGIIWELDGLKGNPIFMGQMEEKDYLSGLINAVSAKVSEIGAEEEGNIMYSLMALVDDPLLQMQKEVAECKAANQDCAFLEGAMAEILTEREEGKKKARRRTHNFIPFVVELLKSLSEKGVLEEAIKESEKEQ